MRHSARAILLTTEGELLLIKRTRPGLAPYWTTPGGGVEPTDASVEAALHRELAEELGARAVGVSPVFRLSSPSEVQHFFVATLTALDGSARTGPEYDDPSRGTYELERVDLRGEALADVDLRPSALKEFILAHRAALLA